MQMPNNQSNPGCQVCDLIVMTREVSLLGFVGTVNENSPGTSFSSRLKMSMLSLICSRKKKIYIYHMF